MKARVRTINQVASDLDVHVSTLHRWRKGLKGARLITELHGGRRVVTDEALENFFREVTAAAELRCQRVPPQSSASKTTTTSSAEAAGRHLDVIFNRQRRGARPSSDMSS